MQLKVTIKFIKKNNVYVHHVHIQTTSQNKIDFNFIFYKMIIKLCRLTFNFHSFNFHRTKTVKN